MADLQKKRNIFSFSDDEDEDDIFISSVKPLPNNAVERSAFTATEFDPDAFLSSRRHLGLERMKIELNTHLKSLKTELVELINRDYQDFINLSTNLKGVDKDIEDLKTPLANMESEVKVSWCLHFILKECNGLIICKVCTRSLPGCYKLFRSSTG
jgi:hypothetical protein